MGVSEVVSSLLSTQRGWRVLPSCCARQGPPCRTRTVGAVGCSARRSHYRPLTAELQFSHTPVPPRLLRGADPSKFIHAFAFWHRDERLLLVMGTPGPLPNRSEGGTGTGSSCSATRRRVLPPPALSHVQQALPCSRVQAAQPALIAATKGAWRCFTPAVQIPACATLTRGRGHADGCSVSLLAVRGAVVFSMTTESPLKQSCKVRNPSMILET